MYIDRMKNLKEIGELPDYIIELIRIAASKDVKQKEMVEKVLSNDAVFVVKGNKGYYKELKK